MKRKRLIVMGFMGSIPISGVIWQHIHYIVGLQRLGHDVYYIEDSARVPYNPETGEENMEFAYAAKLLGGLAAQFGFEHRWSFCARFLPENLARNAELVTQLEAMAKRNRITPAQLALAWLLSHQIGIGPFGVFVAMTVAFSTLAVVSAVLFRRGSWKGVRV